MADHKTASTKPVAAIEAEHPYEVFYSAFRARRDLALNGRIVIHGKEIPFQESRQGKSKYFLHLGTNDAALKDWQIFEKEIRDASGKHIHQGGLVIYVISGRGYSVFDGKRMDWRAGDLLSLPVKPGGVEHQHFNLERPGSSHWVAFVFVPILHATGSLLQQIEGEGSARVSDFDAGVRYEDPSAPLQGPARTLFEATMAEAAAEQERQSRGANLIRREDCVDELNPMGQMAWYLHPHLTRPSTRALYFYELAIPGRSRSGRLQSQGGLVHYVLEGKGFTVVDGVEHGWEAGDVIAIPVREHGIVYQHVNGGSGMVRMVAARANLDSAVGAGGGVTMKVLDAAPEFVGDQSVG